MVINPAQDVVKQADGRIDAIGDGPAVVYHVTLSVPSAAGTPLAAPRSAVTPSRITVTRVAVARRLPMAQR